VLLSEPRIAVSTLLHRASLDARLAAGEDPHATPALRRRASQLCDLSTRRSIGRAVLAAIVRAQRRGSLTSAVPVSPEAFQEAHPALAQVAIALSSPEPVEPQGVAQVVKLLRDGGGPLYATDDDTSALYYSARRALLAMRPCETPAHHVELVEHGERQEVR
jgi:hypothetical protein